MRNRSSGALGFALSVALATLAAGPAWPAPGTVQSQQKISDTAGNFLEPLTNLDEFGGAVGGLGDLDGAGPSVAALAVGCVGDDDGGPNRGAAYVLYLNAAGSVLSYAKISDTAGNFTAPIDDLDDFGSAVSGLGDLDGAGPSALALAVSATGDDDGGTDRGAVYVLFLNAAGSVLSYQKISDTAGNFTAPIDNTDEFGGTLSALGDLDGAGPSVQALAVGAIGDDDGGANRGAVYILYLAANGNVLSYAKISDTAGNFTATIDDADEFGSSVAYLGDLDGAGPSVAALAVGAIGDDDGGADRGALYILFLNASGSVLSYQKISSTTGGFVATIDNLDELGGAIVHLGDLDRPWGPATTAIAVGCIGDDDGGSGRGAVYVMFLNSAGVVLSNQKISSVSGNLTGPLDNGDEFGGAVATLGDIDGTSGATQTLVVGASFDDDAGTDRGACYVLFLNGLEVSDAGDLPGPPSVLGRARPNPFNPTTSIPYRLAAGARVQLAVHDPRGRVVRTLVNGWMTAGDHAAVWDGRDDAGRRLASGGYAVRLIVDGRVLPGSTKAVLVK